MTTMVVFESLWGNTRALAEAVAEGLSPPATVVDVGEAPVPLPGEVYLLFVGGPTHAFSMSRASTRHDAEGKGAPAGHAERGHAVGGERGEHRDRVGGPPPSCTERHQNWGLKIRSVDSS